MKKLYNLVRKITTYKSFRSSSENYWRNTASKYSEHYSKEFPGRLKKQMKLIEENIFRLNKSDKVLDLACADGFVAEFLSPHVREVIGIDISEDAIYNAELKAREKGITNIKYFVEDLLNKKEFDEVFNNIFCLGLFTCIEKNQNFSKILKICFNSMFEGGFIFLKDTIHYGQKDLKIHNNFIGSYYRTKKNYISVVENYFEIVEISSIEKKHFVEEFQSEFESIFIVARKK